MSENKKKTDEEIRMIKDQDETLENEQMESVEGGRLCGGTHFSCPRAFQAEIGSLEEKN